MSFRRRRLMQKLEGLNDEAVDFLELQIDLLLTMPEYAHRDQLRRLEQIKKRPASVRLLPVRRGARR